MYCVFIFMFIIENGNPLKDYLALLNEIIDIYLEQVQNHKPKMISTREKDSSVFLNTKR